MLRKACRLFAAFLALLLLTACAQYTSYAETSVISGLSKDARVVSLSGSLAQCWVLSGGSLVGVTQDAVDDHGMETGPDLALVGSVKEPNLEAVAALSPDFILLSADLTQHLQLDAALSDMRIAHAYYQMDTFEDYRAIMENFCRVNDPTGARFTAHVEKIGENIERIRTDTKAALESNTPRVLLLRAFSTGVKAKTDDNLAGVILDELGAHNIAYDTPSLLEELSVEAIIEADPDYIFVTTMGSADAAKEYMQKTAESNPAWAELSAVKNGNYIFLPKELFHLKPLDRWDESYAYLSECLLEKNE